MEKCDPVCEGASPEIADQVKANLLEEHLAASIADVFKALGDPTRIKIIHALSQHELCVHDLTVVLGMGQSAISHQLRYLRNLRIVKRRKEGKTVYYSLDDNHIEQLFVLTRQHLEHD
ncbi:ArsR/SmtB family transcription factor [Paenibacillus xylaniclasticus]|uniref:ArsR/SmtB family transcription factor n=1 Tax=Paenibacillus xylaniclasticus TaxID=588083 RepID=UPI000FDBF0C7|nr:MULTISPECIES: metalloregulator ArsR/SmtB family transcription factor [Paenibacillus]GFN33328.1 transcription regulator ArsR [Paenibacillus curdlanolyticus]